MFKFEHTAIVLQFERKAFAISRKDVLEGLSEDATRRLSEMGDSGWELVSVLPYNAIGDRTDAALAFFKRAKS